MTFIVETRSASALLKSETTLLKTVTRALGLDNHEPIQAPSWLYDEAGVRAFWQSTSMYGPDRILYDENAPDLLPSDAPEGFSYRFAGLGGRRSPVSLAIALPTDWSTVTPRGFRTQSLAFVRSAEGLDRGKIKISSSSSMSLKTDDNVIIQASAPGRRGKGPDPASMIEDLMTQAAEREAAA